MRVRRNQRSHTRQIIIWIGVGFLIAAVAFASILFFTRSTSPLPNNVTNELSFSPLVIPTGDSRYSSADYQLGRSEDNTQLMTNTVTLEDGNEITVSQYTQPAQFTEITEFKEHFLNSIISQTATVQSANGTIYLGQLTNQENQQIGVIIDHGLIVFMKPKTPLSEDEWRRVGEAFEIQKIN